RTGDPAMTIMPILGGSIPTSVIAAQMSTNINTVQQQMAIVEEQISTGDEYQLPSQAPTNFTIASGLQQQLQAATQYQTNTTTDQSFLQSTDSALSNVAQAVSQANSLLLSGVNSASTASSNQTLASQVQTIIEGLVNTANTQFNGRYLFGG